MAIEKDKALPAIRGLSETAQKIARWVRPLLFARNPPINRIVVKHINVNDKLNEIASFNIDEVTERDVITLANEIDTAAFADAEGMGGLQKYIIQALIISEEGVAQPIARFPIRVKAETDESDENSGEGTETATPKGMVAQAQRFAEGAVRMALGSSGQIISTLQRQNATQAATIEKLVAQQMETFETLEELRSMKNEREIAAKDAELKQKIKQDAFDKLALLVPVLFNKIAGEKIFNEKLTPVQHMLKDLAESISPEQMEVMKSTLKPEQLIVLAEFMQATQSEDASALEGNPETKKLEAVK